MESVVKSQEPLVSQLSLRVLEHELKTPINVVDGYLDMLRRPLEPERMAWILDRCEIRLAGMRQLIDDLVVLARVDEKDGSDKKHEFERTSELRGTATVTQLLRSVTLMYREIAVAAEVQLLIPDETVLGPELARRSVPGTGRELEIVLANLVGNAIRYNRPGGKVWLQVDGGDVDNGYDAENESRWRLRFVVSDTGIGIATEEIPRITDAFVRGQSSQTQEIPGSGLGLWIVQQLVRRCGGTLEIESTLGEGASFIVKF